ncbi:MAG: hypothetical protein ACTSVR_03075 [Candidatus Thorarchaeota archaeon]
MNREQKTAKAVLDALPSTMDHLKLPVEEAIHIGRQLHPEGVMSMFDKDPGVWPMTKVCWEQVARGFLIAAIHSMPFWLYKCFELKVTEMDDETRLDRVWFMIEQENDPIRQAKNWVFLCTGDTAENVIIAELEKEALIHEVESVNPLEQRVDALADE